MADLESSLRARISEQTLILREYTGGDTHRHFLELLKALEESYKHDLTSVTVDDLVRVQTALKQVVALRESIVAGSISEPKV